MAAVPLFNNSDLHRVTRGAPRLISYRDSSVTHKMRQGVVIDRFLKSLAHRCSYSFAGDAYVFQVRAKFPAFNMYVSEKLLRSLLFAMGLSRARSSLRGDVFILRGYVTRCEIS